MFALVLVSVVAVRAVAEALVSVVWPLTVSAVADAVFTVVCPETVKLVVDALPSVEVPEVSVFTVPVVVTRLVVVAFVAVRLVNAAVRAERSDEKKPVVLVLLVIFAFVAVSVFAVSAVAEALVSVVCPVTMSEDAVVLPVVDVPEVSVEKTPEVKEGLGVREMVLVPERRMLDPAVK